MKTIHAVVVLCAIVALAPRVHADLVYDVTFENPPHTNGSAITTGTGSDRPFGADNTMAATGIADFGSQVALSVNGGMTFFPTAASLTGVVNISWQYAMVAFSDGLTRESGFTIYGASDNSILTLIYFDDGAIEYSSSGLGIGPTNIASFTLGQYDDYLLSANLDAASYDFFINGVLVLDDLNMGAENSVKYSTFDNYQISSPTYAVDNFRWEVVPEPSTLVLISLGILGVCGRRRAGRM